jgi:hypothetical protein
MKEYVRKNILSAFWLIIQLRQAILRFRQEESYKQKNNFERLKYNGWYACIYIVYFS